MYIMLLSWPVQLITDYTVITVNGMNKIVDESEKRANITDTFINPCISFCLGFIITIKYSSNA